MVFINQYSLELDIVFRVVGNEDDVPGQLVGVDVDIGVRGRFYGNT